MATFAALPAAARTLTEPSYALNFNSRLKTVLHSFVGSPDGADPVGGLVQDSAGNFYGVAY